MFIRVVMFGFCYCLDFIVFVCGVGDGDAMSSLVLLETCFWKPPLGLDNHEGSLSTSSFSARDWSAAAHFLPWAVELSQLEELELIRL